jgi:hypothetical protein
MMYWCGVIPVASLNPRPNVNGSKPTPEAISSHLSFESRLSLTNRIARRNTSRDSVGSRSAAFWLGSSVVWRRQAAIVRASSSAR